MLYRNRSGFIYRHITRGIVAAAAAQVICLDARAASTIVSWTAGSGSWSNAGNWSLGAVPVPGTYVSIVHNDSLNRLITFDSSYVDPLGQLTVDQTGSGTTTFSMSSGTIGTRYFNTDEQTVIGMNGRATFLQSGGTNVGLGTYSFYYQVHLGEHAGSAGTYNLSGGTLSCAGLFVGVSGAGTFIQTAGVTIADFGYIATGPGSSGRFDLSGSSTFVGHNIYNQGGTALINQSGGSWQGNLFLGTSGGVGTFNLSAGTYSTGQTFVGGGGIGLFNQTGGIASVINLQLGLGTSSSGKWSITGGSLTITNEGHIGNNASGAGTLAIGAAGNVWAEYLAVGAASGSTGTIALSTGGTLSAFEESIGAGAAGSFTHNGGTHTVQRLFIGDFTDGVGVYTLNSGTLNVGDEFVGGEGTGIFNQTGGRHTVGKALTIASAYEFGCSYNLSGGTLSSLVLDNRAGTYTQTGGIATFSLGISGNGTTNISGTGQLYVARLEQAALNVGTGGFVKCFSNGVAPASVNYLRGLNIAGTSGNWAGKWDLNNNALVFDYQFLPASPLTTVRDYIAGAYAGGSWTGNGLTSSAAMAQATSSHRTALGYAETSALFSSFPAVWNGTLVENGSILVRYTYVGDVNLDGVVNSADFAALASHFNSASALWSDGDSNYDGKVNSLDFNALATNFGLNISPSSALGTIVPEPAEIATLIAYLILAGRRHGRRKRTWPASTVSSIGPGGSSGSCDSE